MRIRNRSFYFVLNSNRRKIVRDLTSFRQLFVYRGFKIKSEKANLRHGRAKFRDIQEEYVSRAFIIYIIYNLYNFIQVMFSKIKEKYYTFAIDREDIRKLKYMYIRVYCFQEFIITIKVVFSFDLFSFSFFFFLS